MLEATVADVVEDSDIWKVISKPTLLSKGYKVGDQQKLLGNFIARRFKNMDVQTVAKRLQALCLSAQSLSPADIELEANTLETLSTSIAPLVAPTSSSLETLETAIANVASEQADECLQAFAATASGKALKKEALVVLQKRKDNALFTNRLQDSLTRAEKTLNSFPDDAPKVVLIFSQLMCAAIF